MTFKTLKDINVVCPHCLSNFGINHSHEDELEIKSAFVEWIKEDIMTTEANHSMIARWMKRLDLFAEDIK